jgi:hypothetical protein
MLTAMAWVLSKWQSGQSQLTFRERFFSAPDSFGPGWILQKGPGPMYLRVLHLFPTGTAVSWQG